MDTGKNLLRGNSHANPSAAEPGSERLQRGSDEDPPWVHLAQAAEGTAAVTAEPVATGTSACFLQVKSTPSKARTCSFCLKPIQHSALKH